MRVTVRTGYSNRQITDELHPFSLSKHIKMGDDFGNANNENN